MTEAQIVALTPFVPLVGVVLMSNGVNLLLLISGGPAGRAPLVDENDPRAMSDALPQALMLTAIVITLGTTAFLLAMAYRSWQLSGHDDVQDDVEDATISVGPVDMIGGGGGFRSYRLGPPVFDVASLGMALLNPSVYGCADL